MENNRNIILAIVLSMIVLFGWQFFVAGPQMERAQQQAQLANEQAAAADPGLATPATPGAPGQAAAPAANTGTQTYASRDEAIAASARVSIDTPDLSGSINLTGALIDDLRLKQYRETVDETSPIITLLTPAGVPNAYFAEEGWLPVAGNSIAVPTAQTVWTVEGANTALTATTPVTLVWDNGAGLTFRRTISVDEHYLFTVSQAIDNQSGGDVALYPYARVTRHNTPHVANFFIQHEGPHGVLGSNNLISKKYTDLQHDQVARFDNTTGWLGFSDKYWATAALPPAGTGINAQFTWKNSAGYDDYQTSYVETAPVVIAAGASATRESYLFAGAKEESVITALQQQYSFDRFDLLIDWGWLWFITKPMYFLLTFLNGIIGNFGLAVLAVTVIVKALFFPLASRSYASMAAMRRVQPEMKSIQERLKEDRPAQQAAMMELYKKEKINPLSGCWPVLIQIPVFFALYTVIFISLDMRHAPFFGWIQDLAAPDPTNIFTLFGLIPWNPTVVPIIGSFLHLGVWPVIMGITMWVQMKLNPPPPDPTQAMIFNYMPIIFTFMLGTFPAGLVIYWAWNNTLSVTQQWFIMKRHGVEVNLIGNILDTFRKKKPAEEAAKS
ncbi:MAG: membrane protein insertase YidC [Candidatus Devosia phytovorans]|uniref:Membrane protein insertase YidC n=1 Tax=Candidatus Devosia phytovorans TaxID=3121372 RepID=A0AAJ5VTK2_9HYPH|nr:membrane protein insertase YidC [Devosia sp.]WEK03675.1 MAG: membrane protein insertase YidC [Devosia sp.]